jgi:hypothetical protein
MLLVRLLLYPTGPEEYKLQRRWGCTWSIPGSDAATVFSNEGGMTVSPEASAPSKQIDPFP